MKKQLIKIIILSLIILFSFGFDITYARNNGINIYINKKEVTSSLMPIDENGTILVKARSLSKMIKADINWINSINTLELKNEEALIKMMVDQPFMQIGNRTLKTTIGLVIRKDEAYVPLFRIAEAFGFISEINREKNNIYLYEPESTINKIKWSDSGQNIIIDMNEIAPYRIDTSDDYKRLVLEIENASLADDFVDEVSNKDFYVKFERKEDDPVLKVIIISKYPLPFKREGRILEEDNNLILNLMPAIKSVEWTENNLLNIEASGNISEPDIFYLQDPRRMVVDIPSLRLGNFDLNISNNDYISDVRVSQFNFDPMELRLVFDIKNDKYLKLSSETTKDLLVLEPVERNRVLNLAADNNKISFSSENEIEPDIFTLKEPPRLVIDLHNTNIKNDFTREIEVNQDLVKKIRTSRFDENKLRIVADLEKLTGYQLQRTEKEDSYKYNIVLKNVLEKINITEQNNYLDINFDLSGEIDYEVSRDTSKLIIDFKNLDEKINERILPEASGIIKNIDYVSLSDNNSTDRLIFELEEFNNYQVVSPESQNRINITVSRKEIRKEDHIIVIDPGHGGFDPGAIGPSGLTEKEVNLDIAIKVNDILSDSLDNIILTRETDRFVSLRRRAEIANKAEANLFVSIHVNASNKGYSSGTETYIAPQKTGKSLTLADNLQNYLVNSLDLVDRGIKSDNFYVIKFTEMPAALVEVAFISNNREENLLSSNSFIEKAAGAIAEGIVKYIEEEQ